MNIADEDIEFGTTFTSADISEVQEVVTTDYSGEKIERDLYEGGLDFAHKVGEEGVSVFEVYAGPVKVVMSETWERDGVWYIDPNSIVIDVFLDGECIDTYFPDVRGLPDEHALSAYLGNVIEDVLG